MQGLGSDQQDLACGVTRRVWHASCDMDASDALGSHKHDSVVRGNFKSFVGSNVTCVNSYQQHVMKAGVMCNHDF